MTPVRDGDDLAAPVLIRLGEPELHAQAARLTGDLRYLQRHQLAPLEGARHPKRLG